MTPEYKAKIEALRAHHEELLARPNEKEEWGNGIYDRYKNPIVTAEHTPLEWRYDFNEKDNPYLMQRSAYEAGQPVYCIYVAVGQKGSSAWLGDGFCY